MWNDYHSPVTLEETLALLHHHQGRARIIAGGTDLLLELERGKHPDIDCLIDITRIPHLDHITESEHHLHLGALVNHNHVVAHPLIRQYALPLAQASWQVGAPQIRNRATVAGNLITASPANDTIPPLIALSASVTLQSRQGKRNVPLTDFYTGFRQTVMRPDEILTGITIPKMTSQQRGHFIKLGLRRAQAISVVNGATVITIDDQDRVIEARIVLGSVAATVIRVPLAEQALRGEPLTEQTIAHVARLAAQTPQPIDDVRSTATYRQEMIKVLVARTLRHLAQDDPATDLPQQPPLLWGHQCAQVQPEQSTSHHTPDSSIETTINGKHYKVNAGQTKSLLHWLREDVGLTGTKEGCAEGECGACTVYLDDVAVMACMVAAPRAHHVTLTTIEGLQTEKTLHPLQIAFIEKGAVQCGFCTPGLLMSGAKLLEEHPQPTREQIQYSISGNLCRCTGYYKIIEAIQQSALRETN